MFILSIHIFKQKIVDKNEKVTHVKIHYLYYKVPSHY